MNRNLHLWWIWEHGVGEKPKIRATQTHFIQNEIQPPCISALTEITMTRNASDPFGRQSRVSQVSNRCLELCRSLLPGHSKPSRGKSPKQEGDCWKCLLKGHPREQLQGSWCHRGRLCPPAGQHCNSCKLLCRQQELPVQPWAQRGIWGEGFLAGKAVGKPCLRTENQENLPAVLQHGWEPIYNMYSYMIKLITSDHLKIEVVRVSFYAKLPWVIADQRIPSQGAPLLKGFAVHRGASPKHPKYSCIAFLVQVVLCSHSQPCIPMKQSLELTLNICDEKGSSPFLQLIPVSSFSNILFLTRLQINFSHAAWAPKHSQLPLKCPVSSLKGNITKTPKPEMSHTAGHTAELLWKPAFLWDLSGVPI